MRVAALDEILQNVANYPELTQDLITFIEKAQLMMEKKARWVLEASVYRSFQPNYVSFSLFPPDHLSTQKS